MEIAFLIGNGFDVGVGLDTRYTDFIDAYLNNPCCGQEVLTPFRDRIDRERDTWGDAELAFGKFPFSELGQDVENSFRLCFRDFQCGLRKYLRSQEDRLDVGSITDEIRHQFRVSLIRLLRCVSTRNRRLYFSLLDRSEDPVDVNIINFNYTSVFDEFMGANLDETDRVFSYEDGETGRKQDFKIANCVHVHGALRDRQVLFGVNDAGQIADKALAKMSTMDGYLVKSKMAMEGGCSFYDKAEHVLSRCNIFVLFGLSYGRTDKVWWNKILNRLTNGNAFAILCPYELKPIEAVTIPDETYVAKLEALRFLDNTDYGRDAYMDPNVHARLMSVLHGPYGDPEKKKELYYCDPLHLDYFGRHCVRDYSREPIKYEE